jgi:hypothetical protein
LFATPVEFGDPAAEFSFDLVDQPVESTLEPRGPKPTNDLAFPRERDVAIGQLLGGNDGAAECESQWFDALQKRMHDETVLATTGLDPVWRNWVIWPGGRLVDPRSCYDPVTHCSGLE